MSFESGMIDPAALESEAEINEIKPIAKDRSILTQFPTNLILVLEVILLVTAITKISTTTSYIYLILVLVLIIVLFRLNRSNGIYRIDEKGLETPYFWIFRRLIPYEQIVKVELSKAVSKGTKSEMDALIIYLDTPLLRFNTTGMQNPSLILASAEYKDDLLQKFFDRLFQLNRDNSSQAPDTLAERLRKQVDRAWQGRGKNALLNTFESFMGFAYLVLLIESTLYLFISTSLFPILGLIVLLALFLAISLYYHFSRPESIVGIRPNELGPIVYNEADSVTNVRLTVYAYPYTVVPENCEMIHTDEHTSQIESLRQIAPIKIPPGAFTHVVCQVVGNHTKSSGAHFSFYYEEQKSDLLYRIPISWHQ